MKLRGTDIEMKQRRERIERWLSSCYFFSVALSPLGPVFHYSLWIICLLLLAWNVALNGAPLKLSALEEDGRRVLWLIGLMFVWSALAAFCSFQNLHAWGKNVTVLFEVWFGSYMAARTLGTSEARTRFMKVFVSVTTVILLINLLRFTGIFSWIPNRSLEHGNSLGAMALLLFPPMACAALWLNGTYWKKLFLLLPVCLVLLFSASSGAWLSAFLGGLVLLYYAIRFEKLQWRIVLIGLVMASICVAVMVPLSGGALERKFKRELHQISAVNDFTTLTTFRDQVWKAAVHMIKEAPLTGSGGSLFYDKYEALMKLDGNPLRLKTKYAVDHPHSTFLYVAYVGGIPALLMFLAAMFLCLKKTLRLARLEKDVPFPWAVASVVLLIVILTYGTNGDVFQGRRDISVIVWCFWGIICTLPERSDRDRI